jgi:F-type H+-transporting ATPase subunit delta
MAENQEEMMAVADVYAAALLAVAEERGQADDIHAELADLVGYMGRQHEFGLFLTAESVDDDPRRASLERLFRGRMNDLLLNLLQVLNNRGRLPLLRSVHRCVALRLEEKHHQQEVIVETPMPLPDPLREAVRTHMSAWIKREAILIERVKPELLGGVVIHVGDIQIDGSVSSWLRTAQGRLFERATHEIHDGRGYEAEA